MKLMALVLTTVFAATPALACLPLTRVTGHSILVGQAGNEAEFFYADLRRGSDDLRGLQLQEALQAQMDERTLRLDLPFDDPSRSIDPLSSNSYWSDADGLAVDSILDATHVTFRCVIVTVLFWDGTDFLVRWDKVN